MAFMKTYRDQLGEDYPELKDAMIAAIGCPHNWGYCDHAGTLCGEIGRANVKGDGCAACWDREITYRTPVRLEYTDDAVGRVTIVPVKWFLHTYTRKAMCTARVEYESGTVEHKFMTREELLRMYYEEEEE